MLPQVTVPGPHIATLLKPTVPGGASVQMFVVAPHSQPPPEPWQQPPPVEQEGSGPVPKVVHVHPAPLFEVAHVTVRHSQFVPASGQSRSAQHSALGTVSEEHVTLLGGVVPVEGTWQRHCLPSVGTTQDVEVAGVSPGGPTAATFPHALSHCWRMQAASASLAGEPEVG